jgi:hypothetical protein
MGTLQHQTIPLRDHTKKSRVMPLTRTTAARFHFPDTAIQRLSFQFRMTSGEPGADLSETLLAMRILKTKMQLSDSPQGKIPEDSSMHHSFNTATLRLLARTADNLRRVESDLIEACGFLSTPCETANIAKVTTKAAQLRLAFQVAPTATFAT